MSRENENSAITEIRITETGDGYEVAGEGTGVNIIKALMSALASAMRETKKDDVSNREIAEATANIMEKMMDDMDAHAEMMEEIRVDVETIRKAKEQMKQRREEK